MIVSPSILSADFSCLGDQLQAVEQAGAQWIHFDVFDGNYVKNISFGPDVLKAVKKSTNMFIDTHLVVNDSEYYADVFMDAGSDNITFHIDAINDIPRSVKLIEKVKAQGKSVGVTLNPETDVREYLPFVDMVDLVLVMSIKPGFGGQSFRDDAIPRIEWLNRLRTEHSYSFSIEVDGGINGGTGRVCAEAGADILVAGSFVFKGDIAQRVSMLRALG